LLVQLPHTTSPYSRTGIINTKYIRIREYLSNKCLTCIRKNKREQTNKTHDMILIDLIKNGRKNISGSVSNQPNIYLGNLQVKLLNQQNIPGTNYQVNKFSVISNHNVTLSEKIFLDTKLNKNPIVAISLDDFKLDKKKNWTHLYLVVENRGAFND